MDLPMINAQLANADPAGAFMVDYINGMAEFAPARAEAYQAVQQRPPYPEAGVEAQAA